MKKIILFLIIPLLIGVLSSCKKTPTTHYTWKTSINLPVFQETSSLDLISLILTDERHELDHSKITYDLTSVNFNVIGTYEVNVRYQDIEKNEQTEKITVHVIDTVKPDIVGLKDYTLNLNAELPNFLIGVTATDNYDGIIRLTNSNLDLSQLNIGLVGRYNVKVTAQDSSQNETVKNFTVVVVDPNVAYVINFTDTINLPQYGDTYDYTQLIQSVKNDKNEDLIALGYTLQFDKEDINYDSIGNYTLTIKLLDPDGLVVKEVHSTIKVVPAIHVELKENLVINLNDQVFKPEDFIAKITTYDGKEVTLGKNYQLKLNHPIDVSKLGESQYQYTIVDEANRILYQQTITITVK